VRARRHSARCCLYAFLALSRPYTAGCLQLRFLSLGAERRWPPAFMVLALACVSSSSALPSRENSVRLHGCGGLFSGMCGMTDGGSAFKCLFIYAT